MHTSKRIATGLVSLGLVFGAGVGIAQAAQKASGSKTSAAGGRGPGPFGGAALADYLGLTAAQLRTQLESGKTLAQVATAQSKTVAGLEDAIVAEARAHLDADVAAGRITAAQETTSLADLEANVDDMVNGAGPPRGGPHGGRGHGGPFDVAAIADYLGLTPAELRTQLDAGNSLADVAKAQGKTGAGRDRRGGDEAARRAGRGGHDHGGAGGDEARRPEVARRRDDQPDRPSRRPPEALARARERQAERLPPALSAALRVPVRRRS
jgi:hypothetical protein